MILTFEVCKCFSNRSAGTNTCFWIARKMCAKWVTQRKSSSSRSSVLLHSKDTSLNLKAAFSLDLALTDSTLMRSLTLLDIVQPHQFYQRILLRAVWIPLSASKIFRISYFKSKFLKITKSRRKSSTSTSNRAISNLKLTFSPTNFQERLHL